MQRGLPMRSLLPPVPLVLPGPPPVPEGGAQIGSAFAREISPSGRIGYEASFAVGVGGVTALTQKAYFTWDPATGHERVARSGDSAPGFSDHRLLLGLAALARLSGTRIRCDRERRRPRAVAGGARRQERSRSPDAPE